MPYRTLNAERIQETLERLVLRIEERFPKAGLTNVAQELLELVEKDRGRLQRIAKPYRYLRWGVVALLVLGAFAQFFVIRTLSLDAAIPELESDLQSDPVSFFQGLEAIINVLILIGAGVFFLVSWEERRKRRFALNDLHELRSIAHIIDMHQLTKDPAITLEGGAPTLSSPKREMSEFELMRYLDYCIELLSLTGKVAALYAQCARDTLVISTVTEIEALCTNLSSGIWQKIDLIRRQRELADTGVMPADPSAARPAAARRT